MCPQGALSSFGGFCFPGTCWEWVSIGALAASRLLKALLALWVLSLAAAHSSEPALGPGLWAEESAGAFSLSPQNVYAPEEDPELSVQRYERTFEQNEELGLNDMKTEGYEPEATSGR